MEAEKTATTKAKGVGKERELHLRKVKRGGWEVGGRWVKGNDGNGKRR